MNLLYNLGTEAYFLGIKAAALMGHRKAGMMQEGRRDWASRLKEQLDRTVDQDVLVDRERPRIWFHAASLGEFEQGRPLIEALKAQHPEYCIVQTFFSPSGYEVRKNYAGADVICYLPYDRPADCRRFLDLVNPSIAIFVKYEFWGNMLEQLAARRVPTYLISGIFREGQIFFKPWGGMMRGVLKCFTHLFVQDEESRRLLATVGVTDNVTICGDTRFDRVIQIQETARQLLWAEQFVARKDEQGRKPFVLVAGSSWPKDEDILIDYFNHHPEMRLIIAPHEVHEAHIQEILSKLKRPALRYGEMRARWNRGEVPEYALPQDVDCDCLIIDAIGFLSSIYRYGRCAYIGGGFGVGIHNTLEAAVYGIPVVFGPNHQAFREALGLINAKGGFPIETAADYARLMDRFMTDAAELQEAGARAGAYVHENAGATETILKAIGH